MSDYFKKNRDCSCTRCQTGGLTFAAILITLGVLIMLHEFDLVLIETTWPVILIVLGACLFLSRTASTEGHVQPYWAGGAAAPPPVSSQDPWAGGRVPPAPTEPASSEQPGQQQNEPQVKP